MGYLIAAGVLVLIVGFFLVCCKSFSEVSHKALDKVVLVLDEVLNPWRVLVSLILLALGGWILYLAAVVIPGYWWLHLLWVILIFFGVIFLFAPHWLGRISKIANQTIFKTDELVKRSGKIVGVIFILAALYIFYMIYMMR